ncbi:MAG TPA: NAD(P)-dependent oxidoreductase [Candidatus Dormibacteraeota bacterium]|nr:NAD(P)-dependent oxidoreductase [Candidatus Dormibacteraeota bacterium]
MNKVAVLGTGKMGGAIARRLKSGGFDVSVWDRTRSKAEALQVGPVVDSPAEAAREADVLLTMVTGPQALREVYFGPAGVFAAGAETTIVDMSTVGPAAAQELADAAELKGAKLIEAPVVGSIPAVNSGTLLILAGAALVEDLEAVRPVLQQLGEVHCVGDVGSAAALKLIANSFLGIVSAGAAELMAAGRAQRLDPQQVFTLLSRVAPGLKVREAGFVRDTYEPTMFAVRDILKDLDLALALYQRAPGAHSRVPLTAMTRELFAEVAARVPDLDISAVVTAYSTDRTGPVKEQAS